ncbi:selenium cofactor biosynthesis protein YqeC [Clostridium cylindrosporum]|uniref:Putative selenium-dependent hydroxylase accessory protein YqeC n=1 Tax=Clostridium cylindrosporum DSM 605 TaxID=1121307 RepID=A0A0J8D7R6_CLOCY|nr:selenium cofactor biosynthesis protein YqeC [Clostridium cylindrosporum]KMT22080.1 putative selenium-dependent hydroxylase accessory protein YqeC [Clostridium cylindrosporum DSM 605]
MESMYKELGINTKKSCMISFVGGGGKTSHMFTLAKELKNFGRVLVTTTTKIFLPSKDEYDNLIVLDNESNEIFNESIDGITLLAKEINSENKVVGVDKTILDDIYIKGLYKFILVEADGAKCKPLKAPKEGEPIIPSKTNINIGIIGFDALDKKVEDVCFRDDIFTSITGKSGKELVDDDSILSLINNKFGLFKNTPNKCKRFFIVSKCDTNLSENRAIVLLKKVMKTEDVDRVFISSIFEGKFKRICIDVCGIVMASGLSRRMGSNKLIMKVNDEPMVETVIKEATLSHLKKVIVVYNKDEVLNIIKNYHVDCIYNPSPETGQSISVKLGLNESDKEDYIGFMFFVSDQPFITSTLINKILSEFVEKVDNIVIPIYNGKNGTPVVFPSYLREEFKSLDGDNGGREIIRNSQKVTKLKIENARLGMDVDTPEVYDSLRRLNNE